MKKSISKVLMLIFAVVLVVSSLGITVAFAADTATLVLDSGAITITAAAPTVAGAAQITVKQGASTTTLTAGVNGNIVRVSQLNPALATANTITVGANVNVNLVFSSAVSIAAPVGSSALAIGAGSTVNLVSSTLQSTLSNIFGSGGTLNANSGTLTVSNGISGCALNANGAALTVNGGISSVLKNVAPALNVAAGSLSLGTGAVNVPVSVKGGTLTLAGANISGAVGVSGGALTLNSGNISGAVTIANGTLKQNAGSISGAVTLNSGTLNIAGGTPPANLTVNGGTYTSTGSKQVTVTLPYLANPISDATYTVGTSTTKVKTAGGKFTANLPSATTSFSVKANGIDYDITVAGTTATVKAKATLQAPAKITNEYTGTWFTRLNLPKTVKAKLGTSATTVDVPVTWIQGTYSSTSTADQTVKSNTLTPLADIILDKTDTSIVVKLQYKSSGGGGNSESQANPEYEFWRGVLSDVENASSGDTIHAYASDFSNMPATILETLKGKKITLEITRKNGSDIIIYGKNIRTLESGRITYSMAQLATLFKNGKTSSDDESSNTSSSKLPTTAPSTAPPAYVPPASNNTPPASTVKPSSSSSSSSEESAASSEEEEASTSEEEIVESEPEIIPTDTPVEETPKKKLSPLSIAIIVTVCAAILSGIIACIVLQRRSKHDQF